MDFLAWVILQTNSTLPMPTTPALPTGVPDWFAPAITALIVGYLCGYLFLHGGKLILGVGALLIVLYFVSQYPIPYNLTAEFIPLIKEMIANITGIAKSGGYITTGAFVLGFIMAWQQAKPQSPIARPD